MIAALRPLYVNPKYGWKKPIRPESRPIRWWFSDKNQPISLRFESPNTFDREAFIGVSTSNSDAPDEGLPAFNAFVDALESVFETFQVGGKVTINYTTHLILGQMD